MLSLGVWQRDESKVGWELGKRINDIAQTDYGLFKVTRRKLKVVQFVCMDDGEFQ